MLQENELEKNRLQLSCAEFNAVLDEGTMSSGQFTIFADNYIFGDIYSSDTRVRNVQKHFEANSTIDVEINGINLKKGDEIKGHFCIISNDGEYTLPFSVKVLMPLLESSQGEIVNLFLFTNLAKQNWNEAVDIFYNPNFTNIFTKKDQQLLSIYRGLSKQDGNNNNVEEFLIAVNKKLPIDYHLDTDGVILENVYSSIHETITVKKSNWGYTDLKVDATGDFFRVSHDHIGNEDFENNLCPIDVYIEAAKLKPGVNLGKIDIHDSKTNLSIPVRITMEHEKKKKQLEKEDGREFLLAIMDAFLNSKNADAQNGKLTEIKKQIEEWVDEDDEVILPQLYKIQILLLEERFNEAKWLLDEIGHRLKKEEVDISTKCYYYYLTTLYNRDDEYLQEVIRAFENALYKNKKEWRIALLLLYTNEEYIRDPDKKWNLIYEQFENGCTSPLMYREALDILLEQPNRLLKLDAFEQQVIWHGIKKKLITQDLLDQVVYMAGKTKNYSQVLFGILQNIYEENPTDQTLYVLCRMLVLNCKNDNNYFRWYKLAVDRGIRLTGLYEYYMYSLDTTREYEIPRIVLLYFSYQSQLGTDKRAALYRYVIEHAEEEPELANTYAPQIERFVIDQIREGNISSDLAFLYENTVVSTMLKEETAVFFTPLLFTHEIEIDNPNITSVVLIHDRMNGESTYPVENNKCMIPVYSEDYALFLQDENGNRYFNSISYEDTTLIDSEEVIESIGDSLNGRPSFDFYLCETKKASITISKHNVDVIRRLVDSEMIIDNIKAELRTKLLHFYYDDDRMGELDSYLEEIDDEELEDAERAEFMRFLITRGKFDKAYIWVKKYGAQGVNQKNIARLVSKRIQSTEYMEDEFLINIAFYVFRKAKYDDATLKYLIRYFNGIITDLKDIWFAANGLNIDTTQIEERMLRQMLITKDVIVNMNDILLSYEDSAEHNEPLVEQYYENIAKDYLLRDVLVENVILERIYKRGLNYSISKMQKLAFLKFLSECGNGDLEVVPSIVEDYLLEFYNEHKYFAFFKELAEYSSKLHYMRNRFYIEYHTEHICDAVKIHYLCGESEALDTEELDDNIFKTDEMIQMMDGIYVKECTLFAGEILQYYITEEKDGVENICYSHSIQCELQESSTQNARFGKLNDVVVSMELLDDHAANNLLEEYLYQDYCARDFFRTI